MAVTKTCTRCKESRSLDAFGLRKRGLGGRNSICKSCINSAQNVQRESRIAKIRSCTKCGLVGLTANESRLAGPLGILCGRCKSLCKIEGCQQDRDRVYVSLCHEHGLVQKRATHGLKPCGSCGVQRLYDGSRRQLCPECRKPGKREIAVQEMRRASAKRHYYSDLEKTRMAIRIRSHRRRARKRLNGGDGVTIEEAAAILLDPCVYCGAKASVLDHIVPIARGGRDESSNLAPACVSCNAKKSSMSLLSFLFRTAERRTEAA